MNRDINILGYWPVMMQSMLDFQEIAKVENPEFVNLNNSIENVLNDAFVLTATEEGVKRYESMLGIVPFADDTLESRRFRILTRITEKLPYTYRGMIKQLDLLLGKNGYILSLDYNNYILDIKIELTQKRMFEEVKDMITKMIPANLVFNLELRYNQYLTLSDFTHEYLKQYTQKQLREEVI